MYTWKWRRTSVRVIRVTRHDALAKGCNVFYSNWVPVGKHWPEMLYFDRTFVNRRFYVCECLHVELFIPPTLQAYLWGPKDTLCNCCCVISKMRRIFIFNQNGARMKRGKKQPKIKAFKPNEITGNLTAQSSHQPHSMQLNVTTDFRIRERKGKSQSEMWSAAVMTKKRSL